MRACFVQELSENSELESRLFFCVDFAGLEMCRMSGKRYTN